MMQVCAHISFLSEVIQILYVPTQRERGIYMYSSEEELITLLWLLQNGTINGACGGSGVSNQETSLW